VFEHALIFGDRNKNVIIVGNEIWKIRNYAASGNGFKEEEEHVD